MNASKIMTRHTENLEGNFAGFLLFVVYIYLNGVTVVGGDGGGRWEKVRRGINMGNIGNENVAGNLEQILFILWGGGEKLKLRE